jgi:hypothetical protein
MVRREEKSGKISRDSIPSPLPQSPPVGFPANLTPNAIFELLEIQNLPELIN